jgi:hypothetical protein
VTGLEVVILHSSTFLTSEYEDVPIGGVGSDAHEQDPKAIVHWEESVSFGFGLLNVAPVGSGLDKVNFAEVLFDVFPLKSCGFGGAASGPEEKFYPRDVIWLLFLEGRDDGVALCDFKGGPKVLSVFDDAKLFRHADEGVAVVEVGGTGPLTASIELLDYASGGFGGTSL